MPGEKLRATCSGRPAELQGGPAPAPRDPATGQHRDHWVLPAEERARGFVRPVRESYLHSGRRVCGKPAEPAELARLQVRLPPGMVGYVCSDRPGHDGKCCIFAPVDAVGLARAQGRGVLGGCDTATTMPAPIAETFARQPDYYGSTFCCACRDYRPCGEFTWPDDGTTVGS